MSPKIIPSAIRSPAAVTLLVGIFTFCIIVSPDSTYLVSRIVPAKVYAKYNYNDHPVKRLL